MAAGAIIETPDPVVNNLYKTLLPRTLVCGDLDVQGECVLKTSPIVYDAVWLHATAYGIEGMARRGHFREARQYLEAAFRSQGSQAFDAKTYTTWTGFFNAPPHYTALLWINFHGWMQWAAALYFVFSDDRPWLAGEDAGTGREPRVDCLPASLDDADNPMVRDRTITAGCLPAE